MVEKRKEPFLFGDVTVDGDVVTKGAHMRRPVDGQPILTKAPAATTSTTSVDMTEAQLLGGTHVKTPTAAQNFQFPTGTEISAAVVASGLKLEVGDTFDFTLVNLGGAGDIVTVTVDTGVTIVGSATIDDPGVDVNSSGTFRMRNTVADVWTAHRVA